MATTNNLPVDYSATLTFAKGCELSGSEYSTLFDESAVESVRVRYDKAQLHDLMEKLIAADVGYELSVDVSRLFDAEYLDADGNAVEPEHCHDIEVTATSPIRANGFRRVKVVCYNRYCDSSYDDYVAMSFSWTPECPA